MTHDRRTSRWLLVAVTLIGLLVSSTSVSQEAEAPSETSNSTPNEPGPSFEEVMEKFDQLYRSDSSQATMTMTVNKEGNRRELTLEMWTKGEEHALVVIRKPEREAGTATLRKPEGLWNYAPRADRMIRVPSGLLSDSWMGSHFTNDDLMRETSWDDDYTGDVQSVQRDGERMLEVTMTPRPNAPVVYTKVVGYFAPETYVPKRFAYFDEDEQVRTMVFDNVQKVSGRRVPMEMTLYPGENADNSEFTRLSYQSLEFDVDINDRKFSRQGLRREAQR